MHGLWIDNGALELREDLNEPEPAPQETRVKVLRAGICATDLALKRGYMNFRGVPGHEFVGIALEGPFKGQRVVGEINACCGSCLFCEQGLPRHCSDRSVLGILNRPGAFAEELRLPTANLHRVPEALSSDFATFVEPAAAAFEIREQVDLRAATSALVQGDGRLGLLCAQVLASEGVQVDLIGRHPERADWLPGRIRHLGLDAQSTLAGQFDLVVEASGDPRGIVSALDAVRPRGTVVLKTTTERSPEANAELDLARLVVDEITLLGSRCGPFEPALDALTDGRLIVGPTIEARYPLSQGQQAFDRASQRGVLKVLIDVNNDDAN